MDQMTQEIVAMVKAGDLDDDLGILHYTIARRGDHIGNACCNPQDNERKTPPPPEKKGNDLTPSERAEQNFHKAKREGKKVKVVGRLKPNYLYGHSFRIVKVNPKRIRVAVPDECKFCNEPKHKHRDPGNGLRLRCADNRLYKEKYGRFTGASSVDIPRTALLIDD